MLPPFESNAYRDIGQAPWVLRKDFIGKGLQESKEENAMIMLKTT